MDIKIKKLILWFIVGILTAFIENLHVWINMDRSLF